jgi:hypothetical protein
MASFRFWLISFTARFLLRLAVVTVRLMQWLRRNRLVGQPTTEHFFRAAKWLERQADSLTTADEGRK